MKGLKKKTRYIIDGALIAALYAGLTYLMGVFGLAYGPVQFRVSEALTILPVFTPAAIPGLTVGCFIANIMSYSPIDMVFGTLASFLAAICTYWLRRLTFRGVPWLSLLPPVLFNAVIVGLEIAFFFTEGGASFTGFALNAAFVGLGQLVVCYGLGVPLFLILRRYHIFGEDASIKRNNT